MKLDPKEFKRFKELAKKAKTKEGLTPAEGKELDDLQAKKNEKGSNDLSWWNNYPELTKGACNVPFNFVPGVNPSISWHNISRKVKLAGVAVVKTFPTIGISKETSDPFNAQMRQLWLDMHRKYRGMGGYQRSDLGMAILAIAELFATVAKFERIYAVVNTYKIMNRHIPYGLFEALHIAAGLPDDLADFRYGLNVRISKLQQLCLPKGLAAIEAKIINAANLFKDSANPRSNIFCFDPEVYATYDPTTLSTGGCVKYRKYSAEMQSQTPDGVSALSKTDMFRILDGQINALLDDDDIAKMCSDLIAAYGPENVMTLSYIPELYSIEPVYDYERQLQFHNLTICGEVWGRYPTTVVALSLAQTWENDAVNYVVYQDNDVIKLELDCVDDSYLNGYSVQGSEVLNTCTSFKVGAKTVDAILDTWVDNPSELEVMCGTRFTVVTVQHEPATGVFLRKIVACGLDVVNGVESYWFNESTHKYQSTDYYGSEVDFANVSIEMDSDLLTFDWHPILYYDDSGNQTCRIFGDIDNFTVLSTEMLQAIHNAALFSVFKIPSVSYID